MDLWMQRKQISIYLAGTIGVKGVEKLWEEAEAMVARPLSGYFVGKNRDGNASLLGPTVVFA